MTIDKVNDLQKRDVLIHCPESVFIGPEINPDRIAPRVTIHAGCRLMGKDTAIGPGSVLGAEAPVTLKNCQLGRDVALKGGYFDGAVFLDGANMGSGAHVRGGTILEEQANGAHTVGLKQTLLLPFVTLGSLINFCDVLMAGGTSRKNHSEVGSSFIHFNYSPQQDKATASLVGDVPRGVLMNQNPIFLGGQGGLAGPVRIAFGCTTGAGSIIRKDLLEPNRVIIPETPAIDRPAPGPVYMSITRKRNNCLAYLGNIYALKAWYAHVRKPFMTRDRFGQFCFEGAVANLEGVIDERTKRLDAFVNKLPESIRLLTAMEGDFSDLIAQQTSVFESWPQTKARLEQILEDKKLAHDTLPKHLKDLDTSEPYLDTIQKLDEGQRQAAETWLKSLVAAITGIQ